MIVGIVMLVCHLQGSLDPWDDCIIFHQVYATKNECVMAAAVTQFEMEQAGLTVDGVACIPLLADPRLVEQEQE